MLPFLQVLLPYQEFCLPNGERPSPANVKSAPEQELDALHRADGFPHRTCLTTLLGLVTRRMDGNVCDVAFPAGSVALGGYDVSYPRFLAW